MRIPVLTHTDDVAGGCRATSTQRHRVSAALPPRVSAPRTPRLNSRVVATRTIGASPGDLLLAPLSALSHKRKSPIGKPSLEPRISI